MAGKTQKEFRKSGMVRFAETNQTPSPYSMLQHIGREATPKLATRTCLKYLQTILILFFWGGGGWVGLGWVGLGWVGLGWGGAGVGLRFM